MKAIRKKTWNTIVDVAAYAAFVALAMTGIIMYFILPAGSGHSMSIWGLSRHDWGDIHFWSSVAFFGILAIHLILHWKWINSVLKGTPRKGSRSRFLLGSVGLVAILLIGMSPLLAPVTNTGHDKDKHEQRDGDHDGESEKIKGSMTLEDVIDSYDVPEDEIIALLGLPKNVDTSRRLGQLKGEYGFDMHELRDYVQGYQP